MTNKAKLLVFLVIVSLLVILKGLFIVEQRQQALVLQFGNPVRTIQKPGLKIKVPFIQNVIYLDNRILDLHIGEKEVIASDQKRIIINAFAKYRIVNPLAYYQSAGNNRNVTGKLNTILDSSMRQVMGEVELKSLLTEERSSVMEKIQKTVSEQTKVFGIEIVDVRIMRSDLPDENSNAVYRRMQTEREREAKEIRAEGEEIAQKITAEADKEKTVLLAEARKQSETLKGEGEATATKIFANAFNRDVEFFEFYRTMESYKKSLKKENTKIIISPDNEYLKSLEKMGRISY